MKKVVIVPIKKYEEFQDLLEDLHEIDGVQRLKDVFKNDEFFDRPLQIVITLTFFICEISF